jgi:hypothetical protein
MQQTTINHLPVQWTRTAQTGTTAAPRVRMSVLPLFFSSGGSCRSPLIWTIAASTSTQTTVKRYQEIAVAGFNFVIGGNGVDNHDINPAALEASRASKLQFLLTDARLQRIIRNSADYSAFFRSLPAFVRHTDHF